MNYMEHLLSFSLLSKDGTFGLCEPRHEKAAMCINAKTKAHISFAVTAQLISVFVFAT